MLTSPALEGWPLIVCDDTRHALGTLGQAWRARYELSVVAVTGSNGKTTTKELVAHLFRQVAGDDAVLSTLGNFNNEIGLPLTLLRLGPQHRYAVIELGMSHPGEIAALAQLAQPTIAIVTNAQRAHLAGMGSLAGVAEEKGSLFDAIPEDGAAIVNLDDPHALSWMKRIRPGRRVFGTHVVGVSDIGQSLSPAFITTSIATADGQSLEIQTPNGAVSVDLPLSGLHNASNATQAMAAGFAAGLKLESMAQAFADFGGVSGRLQQKRGHAGAIVIDDTYNANPDSVRAAIDALQRLPRPHGLVLGDMGEVGDREADVHQEVLRYAQIHAVDGLWLHGQAFESACRATGIGQSVSEVSDLIQRVREWSRHAQAQAALPSVWVKGSRFMAMERVVHGLVANGSEVQECC